MLNLNYPKQKIGEPDEAYQLRYAEAVKKRQEYQRNRENTEKQKQMRAAYRAREDVKERTREYNKLYRREQRAKQKEGGAR